jgi:uridine kinase
MCYTIFMKIQNLLKHSYKLVKEDESFVNFLLSKLTSKKNVVVGIEGASASGKTTFTSNLLTQLTEEKALHILLDDYVSFTKEEMIEQGIETRYDWRSRDKKKFLADVADLRAGKIITKPLQDYSVEKPTEKTETIKPKSIILIEGNLDISEVCDITIFLFAPDNVLVQRRLERDKQKKIYQNKKKLLGYVTESLKFYYEFLEPFAHKADFIINTESNKVYKKN